MKTSDPDSDAVEWFLELRDLECVDDVWPAFEAWLGECPENRAAYARVEEASLAGEKYWSCLLHMPALAQARRLIH